LNVVTTANNTGTAANLNSVNGVQSALQNMWNTTNSATEAFLQNAGITNWGPYIFAAVFYVVMALLIGFAIFLIILSKMFMRSEEHTSELQSRENLVCRLLLEKKQS